jgi:biopolymer transport protein ExbB/biopolymer transport protein TolQ
VRAELGWPSQTLSELRPPFLSTWPDLIVAIPAVWLYNYFTTKIDFLSVEMTYTSKELIDYLIKSVGSEFGRSIFTKEFQTQKGSQTSGPISH